jgi:hypothetical protein
MFHRNAVLAGLLGSVALGLTGCMPRMTIEQMKAEMPKRPAALDRLEPFVGRWQGQGEARFAMLDEPLKISGTGEVKWEGDRWYLVGHSLLKMEQFPDTQGLETWTYDIHAKKYRSTFVNSMGMLGMAESRYDEKTDTWHFTGTCYEPWGKMQMKGTLRLIDADTLEWKMTEYMGLTKTVEMSGTDKRVK